MSVTGPHIEYHCDGSTGYTFYRCEDCGRESLDKTNILHKDSCSNSSRAAVGVVQ